MSCAYDKERLTAFFDGELDASERADTERHISGCSECLRDLGEIKSAALAVKSLPRPRAPRSIAEGVSRELAGAGRMRRLDVWRRRLFVGVAAAAALLVALNLAFFTTPSAPRETAAAPLPAAPIIAMVKEKEKKDEREKLGKAETNALQVEEKAANRQDKSAPEAGERRALAAAAEPSRERKAADGLPSDRALQEPPAAARKADGASARAEMKQEGQQAGAAPGVKPAAPPAPAAAPRPQADLAKKSAAPGADAAAKDLKDESPKARLVEQSAKLLALPVAPAYTVGGAKAVDARAQVEALRRKWAVAHAAAAKAPAADPAPASKPAVATGGGAAFGRAVEPMVLEVTPAQLEELRAELAKAGATIEAGAPLGLLRGADNKESAAPPEGLKRFEAEADARGEPAGPSTPRKVTLYFVEKPTK